MPKLKIDLNIASVQHPHAHGSHKKIGILLHETVSPNYLGLKDITQTSEFLGTEDYGIHGIVDDDGNIAWSAGYGEDIYYHTASSGTKGEGHANTNYMGIEQISRVMLDYKDRTSRIKAWLHMDKELNATAKLIACAARAHGFPIVDNKGDTTKPGVTTHWEVTQHFGVEGGHVDCWPSTSPGGYYPKRTVLTLAKRYYAAGWKF